MSRHSLIGGNWVDGFRALLVAACAVVVLAAGAGDTQAQLVFVNAEDHFNAGTQNLFPAAGGDLEDVLINNDDVPGDGLWGWIEAGVPGPDGPNVYESNTENAAELRMHVAAPNGTYDAYAVFWADVNVNWTIRAGLTANPGANQLFGRTDNEDIGQVAGIFAGSAIWSTQPADNSNINTDDNDNDADNFLNPLLGNNPFVDHLAGGGGGFRMYLAPLGMVTAAGGNGFNVFLDDGPSVNEFNRTRVEGVAYVSTGTVVSLEATIDRATGDLVITNPTATQLNIARYALSSARGALDPDGWDSIADGGNSTISEAQPWTESQSGAVVSSNWLLAENETTPTNGAQFAAVTGAWDLGNVWVKTPFEDVLVSIELTNGTRLQLLPTYEGDVYATGDFNGDGDINIDDYETLMDNLHLPQAAGLTDTQQYQLGDVNFNGVTNRDDFMAFRSAFLTANPGDGAAAWDAMVRLAAVPEPSTAGLVALAGGLLWSRRRKRSTESFLNRGCASMIRCRLLGAALAVVVAWGVLFTSAAEAVPVTGWQRAVLNPGGANAVLTDAGTNSPTFGNGVAQAIDNGGIFGSTPNISLASGEEAILSGRVLMPIHDGAGGEFRWGMWKKLENGSAAESGWLGYMTTNAGRLQARNPDSTVFNGNAWFSDQGGSFAAASGPAPACGDPLTVGSCNGTTGGRYFLLAENPPTQAMPDGTWYTFEIRVGRYGPNENTVSGSLVADAQPAIGDYNSDGTVNAADYTVWRDHLGQSFALPNRGATTGNVAQGDYDTWTANFGVTAGVPYSFSVGGGLDFNGNPPTNPAGGTYTNHVTFDFDRVGFFWGNNMNVNQAEFENIDISKSTIETLDLLVNTTSGETSIRNTLSGDFEVVYYEISSATNSLRQIGGWTSLDSLEGGDPFGQGWDEAAGSSDGILSEGTLDDPITLLENETIALGDAFRTVANGGTQGMQDLRFFVGLANGAVVRGTVTYSGAGFGSAVPEPGTLGMIVAAGVGLMLARRRSRAA